MSDSPPNPPDSPPSPPAVQHTPPPSVWPCVAALGLSCALFGIVTSLVFTAAGALTLALGLAGWVNDLRHESRHEDVEEALGGD